MIKQKQFVIFLSIFYIFPTYFCCDYILNSPVSKKNSFSGLFPWMHGSFFMFFFLFNIDLQMEFLNNNVGCVCVYGFVSCWPLDPSICLCLCQSVPLYGSNRPCLSVWDWLGIFFVGFYQKVSETVFRQNILTFFKILVHEKNNRTLLFFAMETDLNFKQNVCE